MIEKMPQIYSLMDYYQTIYRLKGTFWGSVASDLACEAAAIVRIHLNNESHIKVLNLGCGDIRDSIFFAKQGWHTTVVDVSQKSLNLLNQNSNDLKIYKNIKTVCTPFAEFFPDEKYQLVISNCRMHYLNSKYRLRFFETIKNCTAANGINAILAFKDLNEEHVGNLRNYCYFKSNELAHVYQDWKLLDDYEGSMLDEHPGYPKHEHIVSQVIAQKSGMKKQKAKKHFNIGKHYLRSAFITFFIVLLSVILCTLGYHSLMMKNIADIWPGAIFQSVAGAAFGGWGVLATVIAGIITGTINTPNINLILAFIPANFVQSFIPAYYYRRLLRAGGWNRRSMQFWRFAIFAILIPNLIGGIIGGGAVSYFESELFWGTYLKWIMANIPIGLILGWPLYFIFVPRLIEEGWTTQGWWK